MALKWAALGVGEMGRVAESKEGLVEEDTNGGEKEEKRWRISAGVRNQKGRTGRLWGSHFY